MATVRCPTCHKQFDIESSRTMPFCSDRCRRIDLNRWLNEDIAIPLEDEDRADRPRKDQGEDN